MTQRDEEPFHDTHVFKTNHPSTGRKNSPVVFPDDGKNRALWKGIYMTVQPKEAFSFSFYYNEGSEYGEKDNATGMSIHYGTERITFNAGYFDGAPPQGIDDIFSTRSKDSTWLGTFSVQVRQPLQLAVRYESFHDIMDSEWDNTPDRRIRVGGNMILFENGIFCARLTAEYKRSYENPTRHSPRKEMGEFFTRLAIAF
jgi:hypothetical protein